MEKEVMGGLDYIDEGRAEDGCCQSEVSERSGGCGVSVFGIVGCVCREVCMSGYMVGVEYIDEGLAVGACCECEVSERSQGWLCSLCIWGLGIGDWGLCM